MSDEPAIPFRRALTAFEVWTELGALLEQQPDYKDRPVHILDMTDERVEDEVREVEDANLDGLVTFVETDCMKEEQGLVVALVSWPCYDRFKAQHGQPAAARLLEKDSHQ